MKKINIDKIPFEEEAVKEKIDECIEEWEDHPRAWSNIYCDAFKYMRFLLFGKHGITNKEIDDFWNDDKWYEEKVK
jgi:hypothetical protein